MKYNLEEIVSRKNTNSAKYDFMTILNEKADDNTLPLWVADMDFPCPEPILDAIKGRVDKKILGYSGHFTGEYFRAIGDWMKRRFDWYVNSKDIFVTSGVVPALNLIIKTFTKENDGVIIQRPVYGPFTKAIENNNRTLVNNKLINNNGYYSMDFYDLEEKAKNPKNKMMILCSPHNPVGRVWKEEELKKVGEICLKNDIILVSDEIHFDLLRKEVKHIPVDKLFPNEDRIITCTSPSKTFNIAGMQASNIIIKNKEYKEKWNKEVGLSLLNPLSIVAVEAAYNESEDWLNQVNDYIDKNLKFIDEFLMKNLPKAKYIVPEGTYLAWVDLKEYETDPEVLTDILVTEAKVLLDGGDMFGEEGYGFQRINAACPRKVLEEALNRMAGALNRVREGDALPDFNYHTAYKSDINYLEKVKGRKNFLVFLRYFGCTVCQLDILEFADRYFELKDKGIEFTLVLQSDRYLLKNQLDKNPLPFEIISDPNGDLYDKFNIRPAYSQGEMLSQEAFKKIIRAQGKGLEHGKYEGNEQQLPAVFLIDEEGKVEYSHYGKDIADIPSIDEIIEMV